MANLKDNQILQDGINAIHNGTLGSYFAFRYFLPVYDPRIDNDVHDSSQEETDSTGVNVLALSAAVDGLNDSYGDLAGEKIFNRLSTYWKDHLGLSTDDFYTISPERDYVTCATPNANNSFSYSSSISYTSTTISTTSFSRAVRANLIDGDSSLSDVLSGDDLVPDGSGDFTGTSIALINKVTEPNFSLVLGTNISATSMLYPVVGYTRVASSATNVDAGRYVLRLGSNQGNFRFNKFILFASKVNSNGVEDTTVMPVPFSVHIFEGTQQKTKTATGQSGLVWESVINLQFNIDPTISNTTYIPVSNWADTGEGELGTSDKVTIYDPNQGAPTSGESVGKLTVVDDTDPQLSLGYSNQIYTTLQTTSLGRLYINNTSAVETSGNLILDKDTSDIYWGDVGEIGGYRLTIDTDFNVMYWDDTLGSYQYGFYASSGDCTITGFLDIKDYLIVSYHGIFNDYLSVGTSGDFGSDLTVGDQIFLGYDESDGSYKIYRSAGDFVVQYWDDTGSFYDLCFYATSADFYVGNNLTVNGDELDLQGDYIYLGGKNVASSWSIDTSDADYNVKYYDGVSSYALAFYMSSGTMNVQEDLNVSNDAVIQNVLQVNSSATISDVLEVTGGKINLWGNYFYIGRQNEVDSYRLDNVGGILAFTYWNDTTTSYDNAGYFTSGAFTTIGSVDVGGNEIYIGGNGTTNSHAWSVVGDKLYRSYWGGASYTGTMYSDSTKYNFLLPIDVNGVVSATGNMYCLGINLEGGSVSASGYVYAGADVSSVGGFALVDLASNPALKFNSNNITSHDFGGVVGTEFDDKTFYGIRGNSLGGVSLYGLTYSTSFPFEIHGYGNPTGGGNIILNMADQSFGGGTSAVAYGKNGFQVTNNGTEVLIIEGGGMPIFTSANNGTTPSDIFAGAHIPVRIRAGLGGGYSPQYYLRLYT